VDFRGLRPENADCVKGRIGSGGAKRAHYSFKQKNQGEKKMLGGSEKTNEWLGFKEKGPQPQRRNKAWEKRVLSEADKLHTPAQEKGRVFSLGKKDETKGSCASNNL